MNVNKMTDGTTLWKNKSWNYIPDNKDHGANMGPIRQDPGGPHVGRMNFAIWDDNTIQMHVANYNNPSEPHVYIIEQKNKYLCQYRSISEKYKTSYGINST